MPWQFLYFFTFLPFPTYLLAGWLLSSCQDPHFHPLSTPSRQPNNGNMCSLNLNTVKQVTMRCDLSCYLMCPRFLSPSFVLLGASAKSWCVWKISHPSLPSKQVKTAIFISKSFILKWFWGILLVVNSHPVVAPYMAPSIIGRSLSFLE